MKKGNNILNTANEFRIASDILANRFGQKIFTPRAALVNMTFSAELYLKCILQVKSQNSNFSKKHNLLELYSFLPDDLKTKINSKFQEKRSIISILEEYKNVFTDWRYIHENQEPTFQLTDINLFRKLLSIFSEIATEIKNENEGND